MIVWLCNSDFEKQWIHALLPSDTTNTLIVVLNHTVDYQSFLRNCNQPFVAIHLSDETYAADTTFYSMPMCKHVFRCYWHPIICSLPNVTTLGLGYQNGFLDIDIDEPAMRTYTWCFAGNIHNARRSHFIESFEKPELQPYYLHAVFDTENVFNSPYGLDLRSYKEMLCSSKFALCPIGQGNIDSFRVYEALEAGAIPVAISKTQEQHYDYWAGVFDIDDVPFIHVETAEHAYQHVLQYIQNDEAYRQLSQKVKQFWKEAKQRWIDKLACVLNHTR